MKRDNSLTFMIAFRINWNSNNNIIGNSYIYHKKSLNYHTLGAFKQKNRKFSIDTILPNPKLQTPLF